MTCIVALEHKGKVYMGGDSAAVAGWDMQIVSQPKVFRVDEFLIGYTSSFRMGQLLQYNLSVPGNMRNDDIEYLVRDFIPAVRTCLKEGGYTKIDNNQESGGFFLVGYRGKAYKVGNDFQITRMEGGFISTGSGESFALGALAAMKITKPKEAVIRALEIAGILSGGVRPPYYVLSEVEG